VVNVVYTVAVSVDGFIAGRTWTTTGSGRTWRRATTTSGSSSTRPARSSDDVISYYVRMFSTRDSLRGSFGWYRALDTTIAQNAQRRSRRLTMLVLAIGGDASFGQHVGDAVTAVADDV